MEAYFAGPRQAAAHARGAHQCQERVEAAPAEHAEARVSTTDPEMWIMKMADDGFRPAYNVQVVTETGAQVVLGVDDERFNPMALGDRPLSDTFGISNLDTYRKYG